MAGLVTRRPPAGRLLGLLAVWLMLTGATPLPLRPPPPDLRELVPWVQAPLDKPPVDVPRVTLPAVPVELPPVVPAPLVAPATPPPMAPIPPPRTLPCAGVWLRIASEVLECGRARLAAGDYEEAARHFQQAAHAPADRSLIFEARYWYAETLYRLGRLEAADTFFGQVAEDPLGSEFTPWALHGRGWVALRQGDPGRARDAFERLLAAPVPVPLDAWARHGLALALYALARYEDAERTWGELLGRRPPAALQRDVIFWQGEALGRVGQPDRGARLLEGYAQAGPHPLRLVGLVRLGWWSLRAGRAPEAAAAFREALREPAGPLPQPMADREREWAEAGLGLALMAAGDWPGARTAVAALDARRAALAVPVRFALAARAFERQRLGEVQAVVQDLLRENLAPPVRAWVLALKGEAYWVDGNRDEARTQFDLARATDPGGETGRYALLRLAQVNVELRVWSQAGRDLAALLATALPDELRVAALLLQGEAAYQAGDYATATTAYRQVLVEFPQHPEAPAVRLALAWTALRQGQADSARQQFLEFSGAHPTDARAVDALVLASEIALAAGQVDAARELLERVMTAHPEHPRADFARLNRAILALRSGQAAAAERDLNDWILRAPFAPLLGRALAALGVTLLGAGRPADARKEFARAADEGVTAFGQLGLGVAALMEERWDEAARHLQEARDTGTAPIVGAAEYGLAVVAFYRGATAQFKQPALAKLDEAPQSRAAARLLYVLTGIATEEQDWAGALGFAMRLVTEFPTDEAADDALERVGSAAARVQAWPIAYEAYTLLRRRYPESPFAEAARLTLGEAQLAIGRVEEARQGLEEAVVADPRQARAWLMLGRARQAAGDHVGAREAYGRAWREGGQQEWDPPTVFTYARLLGEARRWDEARAVLDGLLKNPDPDIVGEAAVKIGQTWDGQGDPMVAAEYYMTAAYLVPESPAGRQGLLAAGRSLAAAGQPEAAAVVLGKLLAQPDVPAEVAAEARRTLAELRR